jgi:hypothetical protein
MPDSADSCTVLKRTNKTLIYVHIWKQIEEKLLLGRISCKYINEDFAVTETAQTLPTRELL